MPIPFMKLSKLLCMLLLAGQSLSCEAIVSRSDSHQQVEDTLHSEVNIKQTRKFPGVVVAHRDVEKLVERYNLLSEPPGYEEIKSVRIRLHMPEDLRRTEDILLSKHSGILVCNNYVDYAQMLSDYPSSSDTTMLPETQFRKVWDILKRKVLSNAEPFQTIDKSKVRGKLLCYIPVVIFFDVYSDKGLYMTYVELMPPEEGAVYSQDLQFLLGLLEEEYFRNRRK